MIPASSRQKNVPAWQRALSEAIRDPAELLSLLRIDPASVDQRLFAGHFPLRVPRGYAARMRIGDPADPLLAQVLPRAIEDADTTGTSDPVGELAAMPHPGVLHKYHGRVLLVTTGACGIHCRYCFRRQFPYGEANPRSRDWMEALEYIARDDTIGEVILSGGDPLSLPDSTLADLVARIETIDHVHTLRLHTRMPIVLPERVDESLLEWLTTTRLRRVVVLHANHPNELDAGVAAAGQRLRDVGVTLLNQAVLLSGVNDSSTVLEDLSRGLFAFGTLPYYLHLLDPVRGAAHFDVDVDKARGLLGELAARLPGYLVPRLVREESGRPGKTPVTPAWETEERDRTT